MYIEREILRSGVIARTADKKGILVVLGKNGKYSLPKGVIEKSESLSECAKRETYEETGVKVELKEKRFVWCDTVLFYTESISWEAKIDIKDSEEIKEAGVMSISELSGKSNLNAILSKVVKKLTEWNSRKYGKQRFLKESFCKEDNWIKVCN
jgi:ADP-ribose pyrophosphatase YjhB (NUDIX family)